MSKRKIVSFLLLLLLTVSVFIANIIIIENAKGQLPDVTQLTYDKNSETAPKTVSSGSIARIMMISSVLSSPHLFKAFLSVL